ncbi:MAG: indolepyruvate oxidoreductase subunit beta [Hyphomicrobiales bacterium]|nr:indolepyruvate oxidoreductase subunit beta [Hyphomicrobiales bacterium]MCP5371851.1 indolepyruvate oxidoreductase subunit beta [Hyphomicrobiales bacterium]
MTDNRDTVTNILVCGIGGQGVMTAAEILAQTAISLGYDTKKTEVSGMAQRGGVVTSHVRFGRRVLSPSIPPGEADLLLGFEPAEAMRWATHVRPGGPAMVNTLRLPPPIVSMGLFDYPADPIAEIRKVGLTVYDFDAGDIARGLGDMRLVNSIMLGAIADHLPFEADLLRQQTLDRFRARRPEMVDLNEKAFEAGRRAAAESAARAESSSAA